MCNCSKEYDDKMKDLDHVKILARAASGIGGESYGIYLDKGLYRIEPVGVRVYVCVTYLEGGTWQV